MVSPRNRSRPPAVGSKATTPAPTARERAIRNSVAATRARQQPAPEVDWDAAIASLKRLLRRYYAKGGMEGPELEHQRLDGSTDDG